MTESARGDTSHHLEFVAAAPTSTIFEDGKAAMRTDGFGTLLKVAKIPVANQELYILHKISYL